MPCSSESRAGIDLCDEEQIADEAQQPPGVALDRLEESALLGVEVAGLFVENEVEVAANRRQRRAQLVGDQGEELVLEAVELTQTLVLLRHRAAGRFRLGPGFLSGGERALERRGLLDETPIPHLDSGGDPPKDGNEGGAEDEQREQEEAGHREDGAPGMVGDPGLVVLVELEDAERCRIRALRQHREIRLQDLDLSALDLARVNRPDLATRKGAPHMSGCVVR